MEEQESPSYDNEESFDDTLYDDDDSSDDEMSEEDYEEELYKENPLKAIWLKLQSVEEKVDQVIEYIDNGETEEVQ